MGKFQIKPSNALKWAQAKRLYVYTLQNAKDISLTLEVTEKTLGNWIKAGDWKRNRDDNLSMKYGDIPVTWLEKSLVIRDLKKFIKKRSKPLSEKLEPILTDYLNVK